MIVLEYSQIRDTWLTPEHFNDIIVSTDHASGRDIQIVHDGIIGPCIEITMELLPNADSPDVTKIQFMGQLLDCIITFLISDRISLYV